MRQSDATPLGTAAREWAIRVLPRVAFGSHKGHDGVPLDAKGIAVVHHFAGSWKASKGIGKVVNPNTWIQKAEETLYHEDHSDPNMPPDAELAAYEIDARKWRPLSDDAGPDLEADMSMFPVTTLTSPPFDLVVRLAGQGEVYLGEDPSLEISTFGFWQPVLGREREPSVSDVLADALEGYRAESALEARGVALVDVGAALGFVSMSAAARGFAVRAFEASWDHLELLRAAAMRNDFDGRLEVSSRGRRVQCLGCAPLSSLSPLHPTPLPGLEPSTLPPTRHITGSSAARPPHPPLPPLHPADPRRCPRQLNTRL